MAFSKEFISLIKERNRIEDVVSRVVPLKRAGSNLVGCCPFHSEKTPSFTVFPSTSSYHCFGCHAGGDVITFIEQSEGLDYVETVEKLAQMAGVPMEEQTSSGAERAPSVSRERLYALNKEAARFFRSALLSPEGAYARSYLQKRQFSDLTVRRFGIGYAPNSWNALTDHLTANGFTSAEIREAFLGSVSKKNGKLYDIFRNRLMFPVFDLNGEVAAFSGRRLDENDERKYINTSDTKVFKKSRILFGMHIAKNFATQGIILCEGAPDCIAMHQAGFSNAAATLGTAITGEHARMLAKFTKQVFLAYDIDAAGRNATMRGIQLLEQVGVSVKIINLGEGDSKDPDEFIKNHGAEAFRAKLTGSQGQVDYRLEEILSRYALDNPDEKLRCANELVSFISAIPGRMERDIYSARAAERLGVEAKSVREEVEKAVRRAEARNRKRQMEALERMQAGLEGTQNRDKIRYVPESRHEEVILGILLLHPEFGPKAVAALNEEDFATEFNRKLWTLYSPAWKEGEEADINGGGQLTPAEAGEASGYRAVREALGGNTDSELMAHVRRLKAMRAKKETDKRVEENPDTELDAYLAALREQRKKNGGGSNKQ